jgi:Flp pilus assembly protein TadD, contains TPR repeats
LGLTHQSNGDYENAIKALDSAIKADPTYTKALVQKGKILMKQGDYNTAEKALNQGIQVELSDSRAYAELGQINVSQERRDDAISTLATATGRDIRIHKGRCQRAQGQKAKFA